MYYLETQKQLQVSPWGRHGGVSATKVNKGRKQRAAAGDSAALAAPGRQLL